MFATKKHWRKWHSAYLNTYTLCINTLYICLCIKITYTIVTYLVTSVTLSSRVYYSLVDNAVHTRCKNAREKVVYIEPYMQHIMCYLYLVEKILWKLDLNNTFVVKGEAHVHEAFGRREIIRLVTFEKGYREMLRQRIERCFCHTWASSSCVHHSGEPYPAGFCLRKIKSTHYPSLWNYDIFNKMIAFVFNKVIRIVAI